MSVAPWHVRPARPADAARLTELVMALLVELGDDPAHFSRAHFVEDAFGESAAFEVIVAECEGTLAGYALFHDAYEPAFTARGVYLSDIYVRPELRRNGIARALLSAVARDAAARGRTFIWWVARTEEARAFHRAVANVEQPVTAHAVTFAAFERLLE